MANKVTKMEWSSCQLDYVKEFMCNTEEDVAQLPACCVGSRAYVCETGKWYVCGAGQTWKQEEEAMEEGTGNGGSTGGGKVIYYSDDMSDEQKLELIKDLSWKEAYRLVENSSSEHIEYEVYDKVGIGLRFSYEEDNCGDMIAKSGYVYMNLCRAGDHLFNDGSKTFYASVNLSDEELEKVKEHWDSQLGI